ncbi:hypothetical protein PYW07_012601 [Mythimna separata]|uniref:EB domain-containing protein n=1 Tax=Mythimna separata TaxID=271217 RepID=A0AAD8DLJ4_MYTSE|nr:hypothetical protein PYW07_012601 [Mythimna separata]
MWSAKVFLILACILHSHSVLSIWTCTEDTECSLPQGSVCEAGMCVCPAGNQLVLGGTACAAAAPYLTSTCRDDLQCSNLLTSFQCRREEDETEGQCDCQPGFHYFVGRCWKSADYGEVCERSEECLGALRDPYNMACDEGRCTCAEGYYERQRGECRKAGYAVGDGCILDEDCKFTNGACNPSTFTCVNSASPTTFTPTIKMKTNATSSSGSLSRSHGNACSASSPCPEPFLCSAFGACVCARGYYPNTAGTQCLAELGSPSTEAQCTGFMAVVQDGVCGCPANVYFDENMRDCVKATRRITDSCVTDPMCHTFGAASICGPPDEDNWYIRSCECVPEQAVWDSERNMCRLFAGIGESCQVNSDCLAGTQEITCELNELGQGVCTCPVDTVNIDGLCLTSGLSLGEACQMTQECTETEHTVCEEGRCSCSAGYEERDDMCLPTIGSPCLEDAECVVNNTVCLNAGGTSTCQCSAAFLEYGETCWPRLSHHTQSCNVSLQCTEYLGSGSNCTNATCQCFEDHHFRDDRCWPKTGLFEPCSRSSECYLGELTDRVQCRNSLCQCSFYFPYSEAHHTCAGPDGMVSIPGGSGSSVAVSSIFTIVAALLYVLLH